MGRKGPRDAADAERHRQGGQNVWLGALTWVLDAPGELDKSHRAVAVCRLLQQLADRP